MYTIREEKEIEEEMNQLIARYQEQERERKREREKKNFIQLVMKNV